jgi:hypothetical protein
MVEQEASLSIITENRFHLCFALGKAYEDLGDYARSFAYYDKGNALKRAESGYRSEIVEQELKAQKALFDGDFFEERSGFGHANEAPIFILGLPRAGSTLLEQILASHSLVDGTMELANIIGTANRLNGQKRRTGTSPYPKVLAQLSEAQTRQLGEQFIQETEHHRGDGIYFIDKMPNNFRHIPLIQLILPKAKIIDARRHPMACCFSGFKQLFAEGQEFTSLGVSCTFSMRMSSRISRVRFVVFLIIVACHLSKPASIFMKRSGPSGHPARSRYGNPFTSQGWNSGNTLGRTLGLLKTPWAQH